MIRKKVGRESQNQLIYDFLACPFLRIMTRLPIHQHGHFYIDGFCIDLLLVSQL